MSGEATSRRTPAPEALERAFGVSAACNRCGAATGAYRVVALFLHQRVAVRAYCAVCYPLVEGEYHAGGDGLLMDYSDFERRFGSPGPRPATTPVDRRLAALVARPELRRLSPASEALAKRRRETPYRFEVTLALGPEARAATLVLCPDGVIVSLQGEPGVCEKLRAVLESG